MPPSPIVIAHRGASGYLPEHTLEGYGMAIDMGADFIEPDLVITKDGHLICRHDRYLGTTTNVADKTEFADRQVLKDGYQEPQWWVEDFTLAEIKTLKARQPWPGRPTDHDDLYDVPTFEEMLELVSRRAAELGRPIGVYPEPKHPGFFDSIGQDYVPPLLAALDRYEFGAKDRPAFIQSFEAPILQRLAKETLIPLVQLVTDVEGFRGPAPAPEFLPKDVTDYATIISPHKSIVVDRQGVDNGFISDAHKLGLGVHLWTFRDDFVPNGFKDIAEELNFFMDLGMDGLFSDFADTALEVREARG